RLPNTGPGSTPGQAPVFAPMQPNTSDWYGRFRPVQQMENDFQIDRDLPRTGRGCAGYTRINGIAMQDAAMTGSMGPIVDREKERLGSTDAMVIRVRRRLIAA